MRRSDREIRNFDEIADVLRRCDTIRLGISGDTYPYVVPLSFGFEAADGKLVLYVHGAREGLKHDLIAKNSNVCAEADICHRFTETETSVTTEYESVIGFGAAEKVSGAQAEHGLNLLLEHCGFGGYAYDPAALDLLTVYKITLERVTGKRRTV